MSMQEPAPPPTARRRAPTRLALRRLITGPLIALATTASVLLPAGSAVAAGGAGVTPTAPGNPAVATAPPAAEPSVPVAPSVAQPTVPAGTSPATANPPASGTPSSPATNAQPVPQAVPPKAPANATDCAVLPVSTFDTQAIGARNGTIPTGGSSCHSITVGVGKIGIRTNIDNSYLYTPGISIFDSTGASVCLNVSYPKGICDIPASGAYTVVLMYSPYWPPLDYEIAAYSLGSIVGCADPVETGFDQPLVKRTTTSPIQLDCQRFIGKPGERILISDQNPGVTSGTWITDATGGEICDPLPVQTGCVLSGTGPYRVLREGGSVPGPYNLQIRRLSDPVGCPVLTPQPFGVAAPISGVACRILQAPRAGTYTIQNATGSPYPVLFKQDGTPLCDYSSTCALPAAGSYTALLGNGGRTDPDSAWPVVFRLPDETKGCLPMTAAEQTGGPVTGSLTDASQVDCRLLPTPTGTWLAVLPGTRAGFVAPSATILDATGAQPCSSGTTALQFCELKGVAPYRLLLAPRSGSNGDGPYELNVLETGALSGCAPFAPSGFPGTPGAVLSLDSDHRTACLTVPAGSHSAREMYDFSYTSLGGSPPATLAGELFVLDPAGAPVCRTYNYWSTVTHCPLDPAASYSVLLISDGQANEFQVIRRDVTRSADCANVGSTTIGSAPTTVRIAAPLDARCTRIQAAPADQLRIFARTDSGKTMVTVLNSDSQILCSVTTAQPCDVTGSIEYRVIVQASNFNGTPIDSRLTVWRLVTDTGFPAECPAIASSTQGFGPLVGTLSPDHPAVCAVVPVKAGDNFTVNRGTGRPDNQVPVVGLLARNSDSGTRDYCVSYSDGSPMAHCAVSLTSPDAKALLLLSHPTGGAGIDYDVQSSCDQSNCGAPKASVEALSPRAGSVGSTVTFTLRGTGLTVQDHAMFEFSDGTFKQAVLKNAADDGTSLTADIDLAGVSPGTASIRFYPAAYKQSLSFLMRQVFRVVAPVPLTGGRFTATDPARVLDTRNGTGRSGSAKVPAREVVPVQVTGLAGIPAVGVKSVVLNVTVTEPTGDGHLTAWASGSPQP
ncbi:hypothetical protein ACFVXD_17730, partial [Kitasatospora herbaricolor]